MLGIWHENPPSHTTRSGLAKDRIDFVPSPAYDEALQRNYDNGAALLDLLNNEYFRESIRVEKPCDLRSNLHKFEGQQEYMEKRVLLVVRLCED